MMMYRCWGLLALAIVLTSPTTATADGFPERLADLLIGVDGAQVLMVRRQRYRLAWGPLITCEIAIASGPGETDDVVFTQWTSGVMDDVATTAWGGPERTTSELATLVAREAKGARSCEDVVASLRKARRWQRPKTPAPTPQENRIGAMVENNEELPRRVWRQIVRTETVARLTATLDLVAGYRPGDKEPMVWAVMSRQEAQP